MYAVIQHGSHQYRVSAGDRLLVDRLRADVGASVKLEEVLLLGGEDAPQDALQPAKAVVTATVVAHRRGRKLRVMTFKPKKRHRRTLGYRSQLTELLIDSISADGTKRAPAKEPATAKPAARSRSAPKVAAQPEPEQEPAEPKPESAEPPAAKPAAKPRRSTAAKKAKTDGA